MGPGRTTAWILAVLLSAAVLVCTACAVDPLVAVGRPCGADSQCGPGTRCDPASGACVGLPAASDAGSPDGDAAPMQCKSHKDCVALPGKKICDANTHTCVACLVAKDCTYGPSKRVCDANTKTCVTCLKSSDCTYDAKQKICDTTSNTCVTCLGSTDCTYAPQTPVCDPASKACVGCLNKGDCVTSPAAPVCDAQSKACVGCLQQGDCTYDPARPVCEATSKSCVGCLTSSDCTSPLVCNQATKTCIGCAKDADCKGNTVCDTKTKICVGCLSSADCTFDAAKQVCDAATKTCVGCLTSSNCSYDASKKVCDSANKTCVACLKSGDCLYKPGEKVCSAATRTCVACVSSSDCSGAASVCDTTSNTCVACLGSSDCTYDPKQKICDAAKKVCVECLSSGDCSLSTDPICDPTYKVCRECVLGTECPDELCRVTNGSCPAASEIAYVDCGSSGVGSGTKLDPYKYIGTALGKKQYILVRKSTCVGKLEIKADAEIYGAPGATLKPGGCDQLQIEDGKTVVLGEFTITGNVLITNTGTEAVLYNNRIGPSTCIGVNMDSGTGVVLYGNHIFQHSGGGVQIKGQYSIINNFIVQNGSNTSSCGGVQLNPPSGASYMDFINNTVADNISKGSHPGQAAIRCEAPMKIQNSIVWGNIQTQGLAGQLSPDCSPQSSDVQGLKGALPDANKNISSAPLFKGSGAGAGPWHISAGSPCNGKADPSVAPTIDYDFELRSAAAPDIGADEVY